MTIKQMEELLDAYDHDLEYNYNKNRLEARYTNLDDEEIYQVFTGRNKKELLKKLILNVYGEGWEDLLDD